MDLRIAAFDQMLSRSKALVLADAAVRAGLAAFGFGRAFAPEEQRAEAAWEQLAADARSTLDMIAAYVQPGAALLEVGGGIGLTYAWLSQLHIDIVAIEPALAGHGESYATGRRLLALLGIDSSGFLPLTAETAPTLGRRFELIFSHNVLEHLSDLGRGLGALVRCLSPGGVMRHRCPNYHVPYEPHFGLPLLPLWPRLIDRLAGDLRRSELWQGLNFVTARRLQSWAQSQGLVTEFDRAHTYQTFLRLQQEHSYREKHPQLFAVSKVLQRTGVLPLLRHLPPTWMTPMQVTVRNAEAT